MLKLVKALGLGLVLATVSVSAEAEMFGRSEVKFQDIKDFKKWKDVVKKNEMDMIVNNEVTSEWINEINEIASENLSDRQKIERVNKFINSKIAYNSDMAIWKKSDYWASPTESFTRGAGDCEDYAAAKYFSLKMLGFEEEDMRIVVLKDTLKNELHAVLAVNNGGRNYVLDNQNKNVLSDTQIAHYSPIYSINTKAWWRHS